MNEVLETLERLARECYEACGQFQAAGRQVENSARKAVFFDLASLFERMRDGLEQESARLGAHVRDPATVRGALGGIVDALVMQIGPGDDAPLVKRSEIRAENLLQEFRKALKLELDPTTREILANDERELVGAVKRLHASLTDATLDQA